MVFCSNCGAKDQNNKFCSECGKPVVYTQASSSKAEATSVETCRTCKKSIGSDYVHTSSYLYHPACFKCFGCGNTITGGTLATYFIPKFKGIITNQETLMILFVKLVFRKRKDSWSTPELERKNSHKLIHGNVGF